MYPLSLLYKKIYNLFFNSLDFRLTNVQALPVRCLTIFVHKPIPALKVIFPIDSRKNDPTYPSFKKIGEHFG